MLRFNIIAGLYVSIFLACALTIGVDHLSDFGLIPTWADYLAVTLIPPITILLYNGMIYRQILKYHSKTFLRSVKKLPMSRIERMREQGVTADDVRLLNTLEKIVHED